MDTPDHYSFNNIFKNTYTGGQPKPIRLEAARPGGNTVCCIQALSLASFGEGLKWHPEPYTGPPPSSLCALADVHTNLSRLLYFRLICNLRNE